MSDREDLPAPVAAPIPSPAPSPVGELDIAEVGRAAVEAAKGGNMYGAEVARRLWREGRRGPVTLALPAIDTLANIAEAQAAVIAAAASGRLAPRDALAFATMIEYRRRAIETLQIEADLRKFDEQMAERRRQIGIRR